MEIQVIEKTNGRINRVTGTTIKERLRVCAYCRVSTDNEEQLNSYQSQLKYYDEKINSKSEWQFARFEFSQDKYSNGETTLQILEDNIEPDNLYLLDEPEVSLSPQNQVKLAEEINKMARYLGIQFIIATHSPFMLGILTAKIYNLDTKDYKVQKWSKLEDVRYFYELF